MAINVCVLGFGLSARTFHIPYILSTPALSLHSIVRRPTSTSPSPLHSYPNITVHPTFESALADPAIHVLVLSTPNATHLEYARAALLAGKHVVVEKPFTVTSTDAAELVRIAAETGKVCGVYHNRRWDSDFGTLVRILRSGRLGRVVHLESHYDRYKALDPTPVDPSSARAWKQAQVPGNGTVYDLGSHLIDQVLALFGLPKRVWATIRDERGASVTSDAAFGDEGFTDDAFDAILFYSGLDGGKTAWSVPVPAEGLQVRLVSSTLSLRPGGSQLRFHARGTQGSWTKYGLDVQEDQVKAGRKPGDEQFGVEKEADWGVLSTPAGDEVTEAEIGDYGGFYRNLADVLDGRGELAVTASQAAGVVTIIEAMGRSAREGRVVEV